ncbi:unnamed protein product [Caenorhabditis angaria]|uniref:7TM GPCR serpentine receptor class x (Srx) domain-containing protein n=1 Tax=Caenorhabditis angaria TaxID=860376 RepID=A0A9P1IYJ9_9PELO|nr:unnamed protein product [Caenorhabditis angaria]
MTFIYFPTSNSQIDAAIKNVLIEEHDWKVEHVLYIGPYLYKTTDTSHYTYEKTLTCMFIMLTIMTSSIGTIIIFILKCYIKINTYIKTTKNLSRKWNGLQYQLFYALVTQTLIPVILMHLPVATLFILTILSINFGRASIIVSITCALFPALDPFPVIIIVKHYRLAMMSSVTTPVVKFIQRRLDNPI